MQTALIDKFQQSPDGVEAERILRACVHCGFCTATCPTYQLLGDELDGPRGRIYQIKQILEGAPSTATTRLHLDRCLTCRACESTCPSGVEYGRLLDIGRALVEEHRHPLDKLVRMLMLRILPYPKRFHPLATLGAWFAFLLPRKLRAKLPVAKKTTQLWPTGTHLRKVAVLGGCVQQTLAPEIDIELAQLLDHLQIQAVPIHNSCCGALPAHLTDEARAEALAAETIDLVWPLISGDQPQIEAILSTASGCGVTLKEYDWLLRHNSAYKEKAQRFVSFVKDPVEVLEQEVDGLRTLLANKTKAHAPVVYHPPCTQQHGLKIKQKVEPLLQTVGFRLLPFAESHLCCGSAGVYAMFHPRIGGALRERKLAQLEQAEASCITTANIGCLTHLQETSSKPVIHWVSLLARVASSTSSN